MELLKINLNEYVVASFRSKAQMLDYFQGDEQLLNCYKYKGEDLGLFEDDCSITLELQVHYFIDICNKLCKGMAGVTGLVYMDVIFIKK